MKRWIEQILSIPIWIMFVPLMPDVIVHWSQTKGNYRVKRLKKATFSEIKQKMLSIEWRYDCQFPNSLVDNKNYDANYFHAGIFRFGDVGYLLTPYGYWMASLLQRKIKKTIPNVSKPYIR